MRYKAAWVRAEVEVHASSVEENAYGAQRTVKLDFRESFDDEMTLDAALEAFMATIKAAATR